MFVLLALAGYLMAWRLKRRGTWLFWLCLLAVIPYIMTEVQLAYTLPLRAGLMVYAGFAVAALVSYLQKGKLPEVPGELIGEDVVTS
jgi:ABC-type glycerol-3-phosphate transport system permease component